MSNKIVLKKSSVAAKVPLTTDLDYGELALNYADGKLYFKNSSNAISSFASLGSNNTWTGSNQFNGTLTIDTLRYKNSNVQKFSQVYNGGATGQSTGYLDTGEFQPYLTVTPTGNSDNYSVVGKIIVQSGSAFQAINIRAVLRSNALPSLSWVCTYDQEISGTGGNELVTPVIWVNQTGTGTPQFILALNANATIYGTVTVDVECSSRYQGNAYYNAEVFNTVNPSEITSIPANFTSYTFTKNFTADSGTVNYASNLSVNGVAVPTTTSTSTLTNKTLTAPVISTISNSGTLTLPTGTHTLVGRATTDTLTNKTLVDPILAAIGGDEGGQINFGPAATNTTLSGNITFDIYRNLFRIFEQGGTNRGVSLDLSTASAGVGSSLVTNDGTQTLTNKTLSNATLSGAITIGSSTGISGQFLQSTGTGLQWGYPTTFGNSAGNSKLEFSADVNNNPLLNIVMNNVTVATIGGGQVTFNVPLSMNGNTITGVGAPITNTDAVNKAYADGATSSGSYPKGDYGGLDAVAAYDAFGVSIVPIIVYDNMTPVGIFLTADFGSSLV